MIVAVESATDAAGVALAAEGRVLAEVTVPGGRRHAETVAPAIEFVCATAGVDVRDVVAVAVDVGPGLFTGLRVGVATARGLAFALGIPVVVAGSLEILAHAAAEVVPSALVVSVVDARRGEVFAARFRVGSGGVQRLSDDRLVAPEVLADEVAGLAEPALVVGDGARRYHHLFGPAVAGALLEHPPVAVLARLGLGRLQAGEILRAADVVPRYLRAADARIHWEQRVPPASNRESRPGEPVAP